MLILLFRGIFLVGILSWYSTNVWKMIDGYFKERFEKYLQREYEKNPKMRDDVDAYGTTVRNDKGGAAGDAAALTTEDTDREKKRSCDTVSGRGDETCPIDYAAVEALAGDKTGSGSLSSGSGDAADMIGSVPASESEVIGKGAIDKTALAESSSSSTKNPNELPASCEGNFDGDEVAKSVSNEVAAIGEVDENATTTSDTSRAATSERNADGSAIGDAVESFATKPTKRKSTQRRLSRKSVKPRRANGDAEESREKKRKKQKVKTIILTEEDFKQAKIRSGLQDYDFSEFDDDDDEESRESPEGVLVSQLPFKPRADIGNLERVTDDEFCPLTLEDEVDCGETKTWP